MRDDPAIAYRPAVLTATIPASANTGVFAYAYCPAPKSARRTCCAAACAPIPCPCRPRPCRVRHPRADGASCDVISLWKSFRQLCAARAEYFPRNSSSQRAGSSGAKEELKNSMRNKLFALALGGMIAVSANAALYAQDKSAQPTTPQTTAQQPGPFHRHHRMNPDRQLAHLTRALDLTTDQQAQIKPILVDRQQKMRSLWQDQSLSRQDKRAKAQAIQQDTQHQTRSRAERPAEAEVRGHAREDAGAPSAEDGRPSQVPSATPQPE